MSESLVVFVENATIIVITIGLALLADFVTKKILIAAITNLAKKSKNTWDDIFVKRKVFNRLAHLAPAIIIYYSLQYIFDAESLVTFLGNLTQSYMVLVVLLVIDAVLNALHEIYRTLPVSDGRNINGYVQVVKIIFYFIGIILIISIYTVLSKRTLCGICCDMCYAKKEIAVSRGDTQMVVELEPVHQLLS